jgi:hypothetical protein
LKRRRSNKEFKIREEMVPSSQVHTFTDPGDYAAAIRATTIDLTVVASGHFIGKRTRIDLHRLWMQRLSENMPRTLHSAFVTGRAIVTFRRDSGPRLLWGGREVQPDNIIQHNDGEQAFQHSSGPAHWGAMSLPVEDMISVGAEIAGLDPDAAERSRDPHPRSVRDGAPPAAACGGRTPSGKRS